MSSSPAAESVMPAMPPRPRAVLFDWDNTLIDSWPTIHAALNRTLSEWNKPLWSMEEVKARVARSMRDSFPEIFGDEWEKAGQHYLESYRAMHLDELIPLEHVLDVLDHLHDDQGVFTGVVSNKTGETLRKEVTKLEWGHHFDVQIGAGDAVADKPSTAPVELALEGSGIALGRDVWFVGDSITDVECARNCGCTLIFYGDRFDHDGGRIALRDDEFHAPTHHALISWLRAYDG